MLKNTGKTHFNSTVTIQRFQKRSPERKIRGDRSKTLFHGEVGEQKSCQVSLLQSGKFRQVYKRCAKEMCRVQKGKVAIRVINVEHIQARAASKHQKE